VSFGAENDVTTVAALGPVKRQWLKTADIPKKGILKQVPTGRSAAVLNKAAVGGATLDDANYKEPVWDSEDLQTTSLDDTFSDEEMTNEDNERDDGLRPCAGSEPDSGSARSEMRETNAH
jgi:hypothetical protein